MKQVQIKQDFFKKILVFWLGIFAFLIPLAFCFYTYDSAQIKTTLFYLASCGAFFIWLSALLFRGENIFTKKNFYTFLPILVYAAYILISYILKPYILVRTEPFAREFFCLALFFAIAFELKEEDFKTILKFSFAGAFIVFSYGLLQILNLDFLPWKNFFSTRSFATLANPNLLGSYALFISILVLFSYLIKRQKILIILFVLALLNLIFSQSKGAYLSFALCVLLGSAFFVYLFTDKYKNNRTKIIAVSLVLFIGAGLSILYFGSKRGESFSFRLSTWRASLDMVRPSALTGTGIGSFEVIYPAYKRPEIFYIEKIHNIETQHAENYFLEQLTSLGFIGFGLFLWVLWYISKQVLFKIKTFSRENSQKAFLLAGLSLGSLSIYIHNLVDVSIYFASTTFFLILFNGAIFNLSFGPFEKNNVKLKNGNNLIFKIVFALVILILFGIFFYIQRIFWYEFFVSHQNTLLQTFYCLGFIIISVASLCLFIYLMYKAKRMGVCFCMLLTALFYFVFWQQFISNVNFSRATALAEQGHFEALAYYTKAIRQNPFEYKLWYFRGVMLYNRFALATKRDIFAGDKKESSDDFKRSLRDFTKVKKLAPNAALLDYNMASLYLKYAATKQNLNEREKLYNQSEELFKRALLLDPVYENTYFQLANIELSRGRKQKAIYFIEDYLKGPKEVLNPDYLKTHSENKKANQVLEQLKRG